MDSAEDFRDVALRNVRAGVEPARRFPRNIFVGEWSDFLFFDSDWMTEADCVKHVKALLEIESGRCACLWNLDSNGDGEPTVFFVRKETTVDDYRALLAGKVAGYGWLDGMERLACISDVGEWCMYCEPNNDIAVIAFRQSGAAPRYSSVMTRFRAQSIELAIREPQSYGFSRLAASPEWRQVLLRAYGPDRV